MSLRAQFLMTLKPSLTLLKGQFELLDKEGLIGVWPATSGIAGSQESLDDCWKRGRGPIPPSIPGRREYTINVKGRYSLATKGVEGLAYPISPDPIISLDGTSKRSEIMLHRDANIPGSAGCCVLCISPEDYKEFNKLLWEIASQISDLPFTVSYKTSKASSSLK